MKRFFALCLMMLFLLSGCTPKAPNEPENALLNPQGKTLAERIAPPTGYTRSETEGGSFTAFLRGFKMKEADAPLLLYNGQAKGNQNAHAAIFSLPLEEKDLQQCADSIMRIFAEYYWELGQYEKIAFRFTNGFLCEYPKWQEGYRVHVDGNVVTWQKAASADRSYASFIRYLHTVFNYAGTLSMESLESEPILASEIEVGDIIIKGGSPGHVVMVVDKAVDEEGNRAFLLAQGYMPAQEFHVLKNPLHEEDPWYYESELTFPLDTGEYTFREDSKIKRLSY